MVLSLNHLPEEILHLILCASHPCSAAALEQTSRQFHNVTNEPLLWRHYCHTYFKTWDKKHRMLKALSSPVSSVDWKALFVLRYRIDCSVIRLLDSILASQAGRIQKFQAVINFGYDAQDTLIRQCGVDSAEDQLARRYYARALLTCLRRSIAIAEWAKIGQGEQVPLERALGAFDLFIAESGYGDLDEIRNKLVEIVLCFTQSTPNLNLLNPREKALVLASWLRTNGFIGIEPEREYHSLEHNFLGVALKNAGHNSLPLVSAAIYCFAAQELGLDAHPCGFPFHVHVIIEPPRGFDMNGNFIDGYGVQQGSPMYLDPFRGARETPVSDLRDQLNFLGASGIEQAEFLAGSQVSQIVLRCSRNILNSLSSATRDFFVHNAPVDSISAKYAALWSSVLLSAGSRPIDLRHQLQWLMELFATDYPSDIFLIEQYIVPLFGGSPEQKYISDSLHVMRAVDEIPKQVRRRSGDNTKVRYMVGQVFRHRRYHYKAIITGWDSEFEAGEQWMRRMDIDHLQAGQHQSFYHVLVEDRSVRYVAEENIELILPQLAELPPRLIAIAGKHFKRWNEVARAFVSNVRDEYPDD